MLLNVLLNDISIFQNSLSVELNHSGGLKRPNHPSDCLCNCIADSGPGSKADFNRLFVNATHLLRTSFVEISRVLLKI